MEKTVEMENSLSEHAEGGIKEGICGIVEIVHGFPIVPRDAETFEKHEAKNMLFFWHVRVHVENPLITAILLWESRG